MQWLFVLNKFEFVLFIMSITILALSILLFLEIAGGIDLVDWL